MKCKVHTMNKFNWICDIVIFLLWSDLTSGLYKIRLIHPVVYKLWCKEMGQEAKQVQIVAPQIPESPFCCSRIFRPHFVMAFKPENPSSKIREVLFTNLCSLPPGQAGNQPVFVSQNLLLITFPKVLIPLGSLLWESSQSSVWQLIFGRDHVFYWVRAGEPPRLGLPIGLLSVREMQEEQLFSALSLPIWIVAVLCISVSYSFIFSSVGRNVGSELLNCTMGALWQYLLLFVLLGGGRRGQCMSLRSVGECSWGPSGEILWLELMLR